MVTAGGIVVAFSVVVGIAGMYTFRLNPHYCFTFCNHFFSNHIHSNFYRCMSRAFAGSGLQHIKFALLDGKFEILNIAIMFLQIISDFF